MGSLQCTHHQPQLFQNHPDKSTRRHGNINIRVLAAGKWTIDPLHFSGENPNSNLIPETRLKSKFVGCKTSALLWHFAVCAVHTQMGVIIDVDPPVIKIDLTKRIC
jgi:hypothetical protein